MVDARSIRCCRAVAALVACLAAPAARAADPAASAPASSIPIGWAELFVDLEPGGAAVAVDSGQFCGLPCRMLLAPGEHTLVLSHPDLDPRTLTRTFDEGRSLLLGGSLVARGPDTASILLYAAGAIAILTATGLLAWDVAVNVGYGQGDWTRAYVAAGLGPVGLALAIWGAARGDAGEGELRETWIP